jgi:hypothetical protein
MSIDSTFISIWSWYLCRLNHTLKSTQHEQLSLSGKSSWIATRMSLNLQHI